jgi:hypothetical protein
MSRRKSNRKRLRPDFSSYANVPKSVFKRHENGPRSLLRGPFCLVAGTGFEKTCDLWVMSRPVTVLYRCPRLKHAGHGLVWRLGPRSSATGGSAAFPSQIRSHESIRAAVCDPRKTTLSQCSRIEGSDDKEVARWPRTLKLATRLSVGAGTTARWDHGCRSRLRLGTDELRPGGPTGAGRCWHSRSRCRMT